MRHNILLIDSDTSFLCEVRQFCAKMDIELLSATTASQGVSMAWSELPSAIVLAIELPDANGFMVCDVIKRNPRLKMINMTIISNSTRQSTYNSHKSLSRHAEQHFNKSSSVEDIFGSIIHSLKISREDLVIAVSSIAAQEPILKKSFSSTVIWCMIIACILIIAIAMMIALR